MCYYCGTYPYYNYYPPLQYSAPVCCTPSYPTYGCSFPYYGYGAAYAYAPFLAMPYAPSVPRGEHRVGNCLCICQ